MKSWTPSELAILRARYPHERTENIAADLGRTLSQVYTKTNQLALRKSAEYLSSPAARRTDGQIGTETRFKPGQTPWNKGKSFDSGGRSHETRFKKGHRAGRAQEVYQPIGAERISKDGYIQRKINNDMPFQKRWRGVHILVWEEANGPLPAGHAVTFKDGNKQNLDLDNLVLLSRADLMRRNSYHNYGKEIAQLVQLKGAISRQINKRERKSA